MSTNSSSPRRGISQRPAPPDPEVTGNAGSAGTNGGLGLAGLLRRERGQQLVWRVSEVMASGHDGMYRVSVIDFQPFPAWNLQLVRIKTQLM